MTEKELQKLFKEKLGKRSFEFNPENWKAMEAILNEKGKRRMGYYWRSATVIVLFGLLTSVAALMAPGEPAGGSKTEEKIGRTDEHRETAIPRKSPGGSEGLETQVSGGSAEEGNPAGITENNAEAIAAEETRNPGPGVTATAGNERQITMDGPEGPATGAGKTHEFFQAGPTLSLAVALNAEVPQISPELALRNKEEKIIPAITPDAMSRFLSKHEIFIAGGTVLRSSYTESSVKPGWSAGLGYRIRFSDRFSASVSALYTVHQGIGLSTVSDSTFYNFGKEVIRTTRNVYRFDYFEFPLVFACHLNSKHSLETGGYFGILNQVGQSVQTETYSIKNAVQTQTSNRKEYNSDFARFDYGLSLGYWYRPLPQLSLGIALKQGLQDVTVGKTELYKSHHKNFSTRIGIRYTIF